MKQRTSQLYNEKRKNLTDILNFKNMNKFVLSVKMNFNK